MCFTDHYDPGFPYENVPDVSPGTFELNYTPYREEYLKMRDKYRDRIELRFGIEIGLQPHLGDFLTSYFASHPDYDFVIGSNHLCGGTDPYYPDFLKSRTQEEALALYLEDTLLNIRAFPSIDSCGHLDYIARYLPGREKFYTYRAFAGLIDPILSEMVTRYITLEVNTAPPTKGMQYINPLPDILARYREMGGELITIGSDAHVPERIAGRFADTAQILKSLGFDHYTVYRERKPLMLPL
jgi:histidinol-phosphatase (PHP family)